MSWLDWLFHWPPTPSEFAVCLVFMFVIGGVVGVLWRERQWQRWLDEHMEDLEQLKDREGALAQKIAILLMGRR